MEVLAEKLQEILKIVSKNEEGKLYIKELGADTISQFKKMLEVIFFFLWRWNKF